MKKLLFENHPVQGAQCLNRIQSKTDCRVCRDSCPKGVFDQEEPDWNACDGCGICTAACPVSALYPSAVQAAGILEFCQRAAGHTNISCSSQAAEGDLRLSCLAALPWEILALLALTGTVTLQLAGCEDCSCCGQLTILEKNLQRVREFLGEERYAEQIVCQREEQLQQQRLYSRREALSQMASRSRAAAVSLLPERETLAAGESIWRQLLMHRLRQTDRPEDTGWRIPGFTGECTACGLCTRLCPGQALQRIRREEEPFWYMALIPWRCTGCGLCVSACPEKGLQKLSLQRLASPFAAQLHPVRTGICPRCQEPAEGTDPEGLCSRCAGELGSVLGRRRRKEV